MQEQPTQLVDKPAEVNDQESKVIEKEESEKEDNDNVIDDEEDGGEWINPENLY